MGMTISYRNWLVALTLKQPIGCVNPLVAVDVAERSLTITGLAEMQPGHRRAPRRSRTACSDDSSVGDEHD
jgi:hypothetical protein